MVKFRRADCTQKNRIAAETGVQSTLRQRRALRPNGSAADCVLLKAEFRVMKMTEGAKDSHRFTTYFGTDAIAGENGYLE
jgi:hypothetical protein